MVSRKGLVDGTFGENFVRIRKAAGLKGKYLASKLGVSEDTVSRWSCRRSMPSAANLARLAELLHVSTDDLLARKPGAELFVLPASAMPVLAKATAGPQAPEPAEPWIEVTRLLLGAQRDVEIIIRRRV